MAEKANKELTAAVIDSEAKKWGEVLDKLPKRRIKIKKSDDHDLAAVPVGINGYKYMIPKGVYVEVPEPVADLLEKADYI